MTHIHYKGTGNIHSFKGQLVSGDQAKIDIQGPTGDRAWRISKFEIMGGLPGANSQRCIVKVYRESQAAVDAVVNFESDNELLGAALWFNKVTIDFPISSTIVFDNALFSRNIYVTAKDLEDVAPCNYYLELEEVRLSKSGMAQLALAASRRVQTDV